MKNQFFGDLRDLFKYDLILNILEKNNSLQHITFIPMLNKNDSSNEGNKRDFQNAKIHNLPGTHNEKLVEFLEPYKDVKADERDINSIESYFNSKGHKISIYKGQKGLYFEKQVRKEYFSEIPRELLTNSLIFIDPDIGLEVKYSREKHLLYSEVKSLYDRMDQNSTIMIYQHFPKFKKHPDYLHKRLLEFKEKTGVLPLYTSDNEIIFFFLVKDETTKNSLQRVLDCYENEYERLKKVKRNMFIYSVPLQKIHQ